jgi:hypothetical protein
MPRLGGVMFMRLIRFFGCVALAAASVSVPVAGAGAALAQPADFRARADAILQAAYPADGPGAAVIVMRGGRVVD